ncbi:MAG TPA: hypothetical protein DEQ47_01525, partial [Solibacterales bacterium]|nr:hypothetical protein [Bryobacterales bacterium]
PKQPPRFVRAEIYLYQFTSPEERRVSGQWWKRQRVGLYFPPVSLDDEGFRQALASQGWQ